MLRINSTPALTTLYSMLLLYPSSSYSLFEIKDFPCNCLPPKTLKKVLDKYMSVLWMCRNMIDPSISLTGFMLDSWPHWQQEIRGRKKTPRIFWVAMGCYPHAPYDMYVLWLLGPKLFFPPAFGIAGLSWTQSCITMKTESFRRQKQYPVAVTQRCHRTLVDLAGVQGTQGPCNW